MATPDEKPSTAAAPRREPEVFHIGRFTIGVNVLAQIAIVFAIVLMVNYFSFRRFTRWDFSRNQKFALSSQTRNVLKNLDEKVQAVVFFHSAQLISGDVTTLLREYEFASGGKFKMEVVDPYRNFIRAKALSEQYKFGDRDNIVILDYKGKSKFVNANDMAEMNNDMAMMGGPPQIKAFKGEEAITSALLEVTEERQNKLYVVGGHGEPAVGSEKLATFQAYIGRQNIKVEALNLNNVDVVPTDASGLFIMGPKQDFSERELQLVNDYWKDKKGRVMVLLNAQARLPRLAEFLAAQGVTPQNDRVLKTGNALTLDNGQPVMKNGILPTVGTFQNEGQEVTKDLVQSQSQMLGGGTSLALDQQRAQQQGVRFIPLLQSNEGYWGEVDYIPGETRTVFFDPKKDHIGPLTLAVALEKGGVGDARVKVDTARMVVVGNDGFLTDEGLRVSDVGLDFGLNSVNWMLNRERVVGIPPKPKSAVQLTLDENKMNRLALAIILGVPGMVALVGMGVWWQRRA